MPLDHAAHLMAADPRMRAVAAVAGLLRYAESRLIPERLNTFRAWCAIHKLPLKAIDVLNDTKPAQTIDALWSLIWGLLTSVQQSTIYGHSLRFSGSAVLPSINLHVLGAILAVSLTTSGPAPDTANSFGAFVAGSLSASADASTTRLLVTDKLLVGGALSLQGSSVSVAQSVVANHLQLLEQKTRKQAEELRTEVGQSTVVFEHLSGSLYALKFNNADTAGDTAAVLGGPMFDTGWITVAAHTVGDTGTNPPYEMTYELNVTGPAGAPGDAMSLLDFSVFTRHGVILDATGARVAPSYYGCDTVMQPGTIGCDLVVADGGNLTLRVGTQSPRSSVTAMALDVRVLAWLRGFE